jgi:hypothetical protein
MTSALLGKTVGLEPSVKLSVWPASLAGGELSTALYERIRELYKYPPSMTQVKPGVVAHARDDDMSVRLFNASADLKIAVSQVSMHLPLDWRERLFEKIDLLHNPDDWENSDRLADLESFRTFLRTILQLGPLKKMNLGISSDGYMLAGWKRGDDTLALEFLPKDEIRWSTVQHINGTRESAAGRARLERLQTVLLPYSKDFWADDADQLSAF